MPRKNTKKKNVEKKYQEKNVEKKRKNAWDKIPRKKCVANINA